MNAPVVEHGASFVPALIIRRVNAPPAAAGDEVEVLLLDS